MTQPVFFDPAGAGRGRGGGHPGGPPPPLAPPRPPPPPDKGGIPVDMRWSRPFAEVSDLTKDPVYMSRDALEAKCTDYYAFRFHKFANHHGLEDDETVYDSWERAMRTQVLDVSQRDMAKQVRRLDKEGCVQEKRKTWTVALQVQLDKALHELIRNEHDPANYQWVLAQLDHQLVRVPRAVAVKRVTIPLDKKTKSCRSYKKPSSHKKRYWERISVTAYFKRMPRPERDISALYQNRKNAQGTIYPSAAPTHVPAVLQPGPPQPGPPVKQPVISSGPRGSGGFGGPGFPASAGIPGGGPPPGGLASNVPNGKPPPKAPSNKPLNEKANPGIKVPRSKHSSSSSSSGSAYSDDSSGTSSSSRTSWDESTLSASSKPSRGRSRSRNGYWPRENSRFEGVGPSRQHYKHEKRYIADSAPFRPRHEPFIDAPPPAVPRPLAREMARIGDINYLAGRRDERDRSRALEQLEREPRRGPLPQSRVRHVPGLQGRGPRGLLPYPDDDPVGFDRLSLNDSSEGVEMPRRRPVGHRRTGGSPHRGGEPRPRYHSFSEDGDRFEVPPATSRHYAGHHAHGRGDHGRNYHRRVDIHHTHRRWGRSGEHSPRRDEHLRHSHQAPLDSGYRFGR